MFMFLHRQRGTSTSSSRPAPASGSSKTSTALRMLVSALALGGQALAQTPCGCQFDHACFPADGVLLKEAADAFVAGTWHLHSEYTSRGPIEEWCTNNVESMWELFKDAADFDADISQWNTAAVTTMRNMFLRASSFTGKGIGSWDVSKVTDMRTMFHTAKSFTGEGIDDWNVAAVTDMAYMFYAASSFNHPLSSWDVTSVTNMSGMFYSASSFSSSVGVWDVSKVSDMANMFRHCPKFTGEDIAGWEVSSVTTMYGMFWGASSFRGDVGDWDISSCLNMRWMFRLASSFNQDLCPWRNKNFPYSSATQIFLSSGCTFTATPDQANPYGGPFCADDCILSVQPSVSMGPSSQPSMDPTLMPSMSSLPSSQSSSNPSISATPSYDPTSQPSSLPSSLPSLKPSLSTKPTSQSMAAMTNLPSNLPSSLPSTTLEPSNLQSTCDSPKLFSNVNKEKVKGLMFQMSAESCDVIIEKISFETKDDDDSEVQVQVYFKLGSYADAGAGFPTRGMSAGDWGKPLFDGIPQQIPNGLKEAKLDDVFTIPKGELASLYLASNKELTFKKGNEEFDVSDEGEDFNIYTGLAMEDPFQNVLTKAKFFGEISYCCTGMPSTSIPSMSPFDIQEPTTPHDRLPSELPTSIPSSEPSDMPSGAPVSCEARTSTVVGVYSQPYLNSSPDAFPCSDETGNLLSIIAYFKDTDEEFATFESNDSIQSFDDPLLETKLNEVAFFVMPEIENGTPLTGWGTGPRNIMRNYVANGGVMLVTGAHDSGGGVSFLNDVFGWDLESTFCLSPSSSVKNVANSAGTVFIDGPDTLGCPSATGTINCNSVDCTVMYGDKSAALVTVIEHGEGSVIVLGYDYFKSGYEVDGFHQNCQMRNDEWVTSIFRSSLLFAAAASCEQPSIDGPSYQPSKSIQPSQSPFYHDYDHELPTSIPSSSSEPSDTPSGGCKGKDRSRGTTVGVYSQPYLNSSPDAYPCSDETGNLLSIIAHFKETDEEFATFESSESIQSFDDPLLEMKLNEVAFFVMPDIEDILNKPLTGWGTGPQNILRDYVSDGGVIMVTGTYGAHGGDISFLNDIFGWELTSAYCTTSGVKNVANSADTVFSDGPDTLGCPSATGTINCNSVDCTVMYGDESAALVTVIEHGEGSVIVLGYDYFKSGYEVDGFHQNCQMRNDEWVTSIFRSSLLFAAAASCEQPSSGKPSYQPSTSSVPSIEPSQPPSYLRCDCEFDHMCFPADGILLKKAADAFCTGTWDSSHPDFADHGPIEEWCTGLVTNMSRLFIFQTNVNADLSKWNTAAVVNMRSMFAWADGSFSSTIGSWDVSSVTNMAQMFLDSQFSGDISDWNTASVKNMAAMFRNTASFNSDISGWNVASVTSMWSMFRNADKFNIDISGWTVSSVTSMSSMFDEAASFNIDLAGWDLSSIGRMHSMFRRAGSFNQNLCAWKDKNFPYDQANNIFHRSGCTFNENPDGDNGGPFCAHDCSPPPSEYTTSNVDAASSFARGVMYTISAKSQQVTIKGLGVLGRNTRESNVRMYYQNGSYDDFEALDQGNWIQVFRGNVMLEANKVVTITIPLNQAFTIPAGGTVSVYVVSPRGMLFKSATANEFDGYAETDSFVLKVGVSTRKVFESLTGLAEFAGTILYEV